MKYYFKCPKCKSDERFSSPSENNSDLGCVLFIFGGFIPALIYADAVSRRVQCRKCGFIFRKPPFPRTSVSRLAAWVIVIVMLFTFITYFLITFPDLFLLIPEHESISVIEALVVKNPKAVAIGFIGMMFALLVVAFATSWASNLKARSMLKKEYYTNPTPYQFSVDEVDATEASSSAKPVNKDSDD